MEDFYMNIVLEDERAIVPTQANDGDAGFDVYTPFDIRIFSKQDVKVPLGFRCEFPKGYALLMVNKSGRAVKDKIINGAQLIDSGYRGICHAHLFNIGDNLVDIKRGEKISQFIVIPVWHGKINVVKQLISEETMRGAGGFGSTGK